jgi:hypothetical protein
MLCPQAQVTRERTLAEDHLLKNIACIGNAPGMEKEVEGTLHESFTIFRMLRLSGMASWIGLSDLMAIFLNPGMFYVPKPV